MEVSSLSEIASKAVVNYIANGHYDNTPYEFCPEISNQIYLLCYDMEITKRVLEQFRTKLNLTEASFRRIKFEKYTFQMLQNQNLERLQLGRLCNWKEAYDDENGRFKIVQFLKDLLNEQSRLKMTFLGIGKDRLYEQDWTKSIGLLLPNLETLDIWLIPLETKDFQNICESFKNLKVLKIDPGEIKSLSGISNLKSLEVLVAKELQVDTKEGMMDLFDCKTLRLLDFSRYERKVEDPDIVEIYLSCEKVLEELRFIDCRNLDIDESKLERLMKTHRKLEQVVVLQTLLEHTILPGIELLNCSTLQSFVKILRLHLSNGDVNYIAWIMERLRVLYIQTWADADIDIPVLCEIVNVTYQILNKFALYSTLVGQGIKLLREIAREKFIKHLPIKEAAKIFEQFVKIGTTPWFAKLPSFTNNDIWECLSQKHVLELPCLPVRKLCRFAVISLDRAKETVFDAKEYIVLEKLITRLTLDDREGFYNLENLMDHMISLIRFAYQQPEGFLTEKKSIIKMALDVIYETTRHSEEKCLKITSFGMKSRSVFQVLIHICKSQWKEQPEQLRALKIIMNLTRLEDFEERCGKYLMPDVPYLVKMLKGDTNASFCTIAILSRLICCKLPKKGFYDFWNKINLRIMSLCSKIQPEQIIENLDIFLNSSILKDTFLSSYFDGPKVWALLTMKIMLERDGKVGEKFKKAGLYDIVKNNQSKEKKVMEMKEVVMGLMNKCISVS